ncbi:MAG: hypothetical protein CMH32_03045 [Micavibrio sp.]|nr:hypothetical protein [Micavibrio sp.]HCK32738.1 hypothetical protein [Rhodospirillaceae bacterium]|tara:strand:+ start:1145 stop:1426 length:282 start_codon:yes stop_codon:yes gene_type:complete
MLKANIEFNTRDQDKQKTAICNFFIFASATGLTPRVITCYQDKNRAVLVFDDKDSNLSTEDFVAAYNKNDATGLMEDRHKATNGYSALSVQFS